MVCNWEITNEGRKVGGDTKYNSNYGEYLVWPENISLDGKNIKNVKLFSATALAKHFDISSQRFNLLLNELGWIKKTVSGWGLTKLGSQVGGVKFEHETSGGSYVMWPEKIVENKNIRDMFHDIPEPTKVNKEINSSENRDSDKVSNDFRKKYKAEYRTKDGHYVRSKAELTIDDSLYLWGIAHAYEKKLPNTKENVYSDFHIPSGNGRPDAFYIEYWGLENDEQYNRRKNKKIEIYRELGLKLIQLNDSDIKNIEDSLQKHMLKHRIKVSMG